jgi:hypothetical protein
MPFPSVGLCEYFYRESIILILSLYCALADTQAPALRSLLLSPRPPFPEPASADPSSEDEPLLSKIVVYTEHPDTIRRGGALGCIKNCAMDRGSMPWLLASESEHTSLLSEVTKLIV